MNEIDRREAMTVPLRMEVLEDRLAAASVGSWSFGGWAAHQLSKHSHHWSPPSHSWGWQVDWWHGRCGKGHQPPSPPPAQTGSVAGVVYLDANGNGGRDNGESGVGGKVVWADTNNNGVLDAGERSTTTAGDGSYTLGNLPAGTGVVIRTTQPDGVPTTGVSVTPTAGQTLHGVDVGLNDSSPS